MPPRQLFSDLFINISNSPFTLGKTQRRHRLFGKSIGQLNVPALYVNCTGIQNNGKNVYTFDGASGAYTKDGSLHYESPLFKEELAVLDFDETTHAFVSPQKQNPPDEEVADIYHSLHYGIQSFMENAGLSKVVLGVSGGIDSAVNAALYASISPPKKIFSLSICPVSTTRL